MGAPRFQHSASAEIQPISALSIDPPQPPPGFEPLPALSGGEQPTLAHVVYEKLEAHILEGAWLPDTRLSLRTLAGALDTSMQPVREAVGRLIDAQALVSTPGKAIRVPRLDRKTSDEIWSLRSLLEGEAAAKFAARKRPKEARELYQYTKALRSLKFGADLEPTMRAIMAWNLALAKGSGSPLLVQTISRLRLRYAPFIAEALAVKAPVDEVFLGFTLHMQDELVMAIEAGDAEAARHLRCADLRSFQRYLYSHKAKHINF